MKKTLTFILTMVMVFAFAGPAFALTNRQPVVVQPGAPACKVGLDLQIIAGIPSTATPYGTVMNWAGLNSEASAYFEGRVIYFNAQINQGATDGASDIVSTLYRTKNPSGSLKIASSGVDLSLANVYKWDTTLYGVLSSTAAAGIGSLASGFSTNVLFNGDDAHYIYNYTFNGVVTSAAPVVTATLTIGPGSTAVANNHYIVYADPGASTDYVPAYEITKYVNTPAPKVTYQVRSLASGATWSILFTLQKDKGLLDSMDYYDGTVTWDITRVVDAGGYSHWAFTNGMLPMASDKALIASANLDAVFAFFGFNYALNGEIWDIDFLARANFVLTDTVNVKTTTSTITPNNGSDDEEVPVTGESASVFGFVMIGVAFIAAVSLAAALKKSRQS